MAEEFAKQCRLAHIPKLECAVVGPGENLLAHRRETATRDDIFMAGQAAPVAFGVQFPKDQIHVPGGGSESQSAWREGDAGNRPPVRQKIGCLDASSRLPVSQK